MRFGTIIVSLVYGSAFLHLAAQVPSDSHSGENVSAISLIANPHRDVNPFFALLTQHAGEPYSQEKIDADAKALQRAGDFADVRVSVVSDVAGLRLQFILEPPYYLGVVQFPGASFTYTRLLQVADLPDEDPYDASRIPVAENALREFLRRTGYFQSEVHAETAIDDAHQIVNIAFKIVMGNRARISSVNIEGPDDPEKARLFRAMRSLRARLSSGLLKPGKSYTRERIQAATRLMKKSLTGRHRLASSIQENPPKYDPQTNAVEVSFKVKVGPLVMIRAEGAKLSLIPYVGRRQIKKLVPIYSEGGVDRELVDEGQRNLADYFQKKGYSDVKVTTSFETQPDKIEIVYAIDRGKKHKVDRILFHGNAAVTTKELMQQVTVKTSHLWTHGSLSQKLLKQSTTNIEALYRDRGYEDVKITPKVVDREPKIDVDIAIDEGGQTLVQEVKVAGNQNVEYAQLTAPKGFQLSAGAPFSPRKMTEDRNRISATYLNRGYLNVEVKATAQRVAGDFHRVNVTYAIEEHQLVLIDDVVYLGQERTRMSLLTRTARAEQGTPMRRGDLLEAESRLYDLNIFDWSSVGPRRPINTQDDETTLIKVHEAKRNEITWGIGFEAGHRGGNVPSGSIPLPGGGGSIGLNGYKVAPSESTYASPRGLIEYTRRNMRGLGETASGSILISQLDQRLLSTYGQPHFFGTDWKSLGSFSLERNSQNPLFIATYGDLSFQVERSLNRSKNTRLQLRYDFNHTVLSDILVPDLVLPKDENVWLSTFSGSLIRDTRDMPLDAHRGSFATADLGVTPTALGSSADFVKFFGQYAYYKSLHSVVFANSVRLGLAPPFAGSFVPTSQLFFTGGSTSLRSFPIDQAGPQRLVPFCNVLEGEQGCVNITVPVGGKQLFILNSEVRFPMRIMKALGGVVFYDGGNVYSAINLHDFVSNYTNTVGFGLRYSTPIGPVRIDVGRNLSPIPGINPTQYYITIGQAF
ncbi:MAG TPA: POTRA domain-containing protein [Candidatus Binatia bacterium]|nr:POTRA domain-containing protein [Candidatus Binatia bacterium]